MAEKTTKNNSKIVHVFENGATLIYAHQNVSNTTDATVGFRCGAQCDGEQHGLSHLLEHMLSMGVKKEKLKEYQQILLQTATYDNAMTSFDFISTIFNCLSFNLENIMQIESDILLGEKHFDPKVLENEKKVVLHEYDGRYDEEIINRHIDDILGNYQEDEILKTRFINQFKDMKDINERLIGSPETLRDITPQTLQDYIDKYFVSENMFISIVSDLPYETILGYVEKYYISKVKSNPNNKVEPLTYFKQGYIRKHKLLQTHKQDAREFNCKIFFKTPKYDKKESYLYSYLDNILFNNDTGILMKKLRQENGYTYTSYMHSLGFNGDGSNIKRFDILTSPENAVDAIKVFTTSLGRLIEEGITEQDLENFQLNMLSRESYKRFVSNYSSMNLFAKAVAGKTDTSKSTQAQINYTDLTVDMVNDYLRKTYGMSKVGVIFDGDLDKAEHLLSKEKLEQMTDEYINSLPFGVNYETCVDNFYRAYESQITPLPTLQEMLADFNYAEKMLSKTLKNNLEVSNNILTKIRTNNFKQISKAQVKKAIRKARQTQQSTENEDELTM